MPYASSSEPPPLLLFASLYGNPDSPSPQQRSEARPKYRNPCSPCSSLARQTAFFLSLPQETPQLHTRAFPLSIRHFRQRTPFSPPATAPPTAALPRRLPGANAKGHLYPELFLQSEHIEPLCSPCPPPSPLCAFTQTHPLPAMSYIYLHYRGKKLMNRSFASATIQTVFNSALLNSG